MEYLSLITQGLLLGLTLAILLGPIFVTLTQLALEKGARAGIVASTGVWISDIIIHHPLLHIYPKSQLSDRGLYIYLLDGPFRRIYINSIRCRCIIQKSKIGFDSASHSTNDYFSFWSKGFLVNTVNPFTFVFWIGVISTYVIKAKISGLKSFVFFSSIMFVIILTDTLKVFLAKAIRTKLKQKHFTFFSRLAGTGLIIFGIALLLKSQVF